MKTSNKQKRTGRTTGKGRKTPAVDYMDWLLKRLKNKKYAAGYLTAAWEEGEDVFLLALRDVAQAHGSMTRLARASKLNRENLYQMLSKRGNPRLSSIVAVLRILGLRIEVTPQADSAGTSSKAA